MHLRLDRFASPIGTLQLVTDAEGRLRVLDFHDHAERMHRLLRRHYGTFQLDNFRAPASIIARLEAYFAGDIACLAAVPVATAGTAFQRRVWAALREIPAGTTTSYGQLATKLGNPKGSRAVGLANGANPVGIVVPCHRVIGANGALTGFGGGLDRKRWLLEHEGRPGALPLDPAGAGGPRPPFIKSGDREGATRTSPHALSPPPCPLT